MEGSTYGLELVYPFDAECSVSLKNGELHFDGNPAEETDSSMKDPPIKQFAPNHYKAPWPGQTHVFRKGEPYAQILVLPRKALYDPKPMDEEQSSARERASALINECGEEIAKRGWTDDQGRYFNDKYKVLQAAFLKRGHEGVKDVLMEAIKAWLPKQSASRSKGKTER